MLAAAGPGLASCGGENLMETLPEPVRAELGARADDTPFGDGIAWEVAGPEGASSLIFGTLHLPGLDVPEPVAERIAEARHVFVEITGEERARMQAALSADPHLLIGPAGENLGSTLEGPELAHMVSLIVPRGIAPQVVPHLRPWFAAMLLGLPACAQALPGPTLDTALETLARGNGVAVAGLEGWEAALSALAETPLDMQVRSLRTSLRLQPLTVDVATTMQALYAEEEVASIAVLSDALGGAFAEGGPPDREALLDARTAAWLPRIEAELAQGDAVIAVGALHLIGEAGLLYALHESGYAVRRVPLGEAELHLAAD
ncbi:TraB/GumN family protein [Pontivivens ytuae]|uniref:TraB/GumN family protein n=1 Tax=Pontivivens ytuae TaxID=2789856 RepID=A0A7S9LPL7_9RHOB|nr:TraB/GumN family protein [Pontivivens ytuae]QPH52425.1 TraB/GumN family protein [Pontivivens ytuae]